MIRPSSPPRRRLAVLAAAVLATVVAVAALITGCSSSGSPDPLAQAPSAPPTPDTVRVGSANFTENRLLAEIYASGLEDRGVRVERRYSVGTREVYLPALQDGSIDLVPEYTGNLLTFLDKSATATAPDQVYQQAASHLPPSLRLLTASRAQDQDAVVVTRVFAAANNLRSIDDLARLCPTISFGGPPEFVQRAYGTPGLARNYNCSFREFRSLDTGGPLTVAALRNNDVQAADLFTTDSSIPQDDFVALTDPRSNFAAQNVAPLINATKAGDPRVTEVLDRISAALDTAVLTDLNRRLAGPDHPDPAQLARDWLTSIGIR